MGRPLNNNLFGNPLNTSDNLPVLIFNTAIVNGVTLSNVYIEKQLKPTEFLISNGSVSGIVDLVPNDPTTDGEACMKVITPSGETVYAVKIYLNTIECSDGNTYYWNRYNYTSSNDDTIIVNSMVASQYKASNGTNESGGEISTISENINHQSFSSDPAATNVVGVGGAGVNASFNILSTNKSLFTVKSVSMLNGGQNYKVGDFISIPNVGNIKVKTTISYPNYIDTFTLNQDKQLYESDVSGTYNIKDGSGVNAQFTCATENTTGYEVASILVAKGGSGYKVGDSIQTDYGTLNITSVNASTYAITAITVTPPTTVFTTDPTAKSIAVTGGSGTKATLDITASEVFTAKDASILLGGINYVVGDKLTLSNCGVATVDSVDTGTHGIKNITYVQNDTFYSKTDDSGTISASGGSGTGATFSVSYIESPLYIFSGVTVNAIGTGYKVSDTIIIPNVGTITVESVSSAGAIETVTANLNTTLHNKKLNLTAQTGTGGYGTGATFDIEETQNGTGYIVSSVVIKTEGSGYTLSDSLTTVFGTINVSELDTGTGAIKSISFVSDGEYHSSDPSLDITVTGGSGTGATFNVSTTLGYQITDIDISNGGSNYAVGDKISITSYSAESTTITTDITATVSAVETGNYAVTGISIVNPLIETTDMAGANIAVTGGSGTGLALNIISNQVSGYKISSFTLSNHGYGYAVGDTLTITNIGTVSVTGVKSIFGIISSFQNMFSNETYYQNMENPSLTVIGGSGSGLTLSVTSSETPQYFISGIELNKPGNGYEVNDILRIGNAGTVTVTGISN